MKILRKRGQKSKNKKKLKMSGPVVSDYEVAGSITSIYRNFKCWLGLENRPSSLVRTIGYVLNWEVAELIKEVNINRLDGT